MSALFFKKENSVSLHDGIDEFDKKRKRKQLITDSGACSLKNPSLAPPNNLIFLEKQINPPPPPPDWLKLPFEITSLVLEKVGVVGIIYAAEAVCNLWNSISKNPKFYEVLDFRNADPYHYFQKSGVNLEKIGHEAIRRSKNLRELYLDDPIACDDILVLNVDKFSNLRTLLLSRCCKVSSYGLINALNYCPRLKDVSISMRLVSKPLMEQFGKSCLDITSFEITSTSNRMLGWQVLTPGCASLIAENLPRIKKLMLRGIQVSFKEEYFAIVKGCHSLEHFMDGRIDLQLSDRVALKRLEQYWNGELMEEEKEQQQKEEVEEAGEEEEDEDRREGNCWAEMTDDELNHHLPRKAESYMD